MEKCQNCETILKGRYCHVCGQNLEGIAKPFKDMLLASLGSFVSYDSKVNRTFVPLLLMPWKIINEYLSGKRIKYISPFRLYFFTSLVFFLIFNVTSESINKNSSDDVENLPSEVAEFKEETNIAADDSERIALNKTEPENQQPNNNEVLDVNVEFDVVEKLGEFDQQDMDRLSDYLWRDTPKVMILNLPVFALIFQLFYFSSRKLYAENLVFVFYFQSFVFSMLSLMAIFYWMADVVEGGILGFMANAFNVLADYLILWVCLCALLCLKFVYAQVWILTIVKYLVISIINITILLTTLLVLVFWEIGSVAGLIN